jgi:hypothetical protein
MDLYSLFFRFKHLMILCFSHYLWAWIRDFGEEVLKTEKGFCQAQAHSQKPPQFLHKCHGLEDSNGSLQPIFQKIDSYFIAGSSKCVAIIL